MNELYSILNLMERVDPQYRRYATILNEDKRGKAAKKECYEVLRRFFKNSIWLDKVLPTENNPHHLSAIDWIYDKFIDRFYHENSYRSSAIMRLAPMFLRLALEAGFEQGREDATKMNRLHAIEDYLHQANKTQGMDLKNVSITLSYEELNNTFGKAMDEEEKAKIERIRSDGYEDDGNYNGYEIVGPLTYEQAHEYGNKSCPGSLLCYTQGESTWDQYTAQGMNDAYVLLKDGWEDIPAEHGNGMDGYDGYDRYGLSMIFVFVSGDGRLAYCNTRWNHYANYKPGRSVDHALDEEDISKLIGKNFYKVFKPNDKWEKAVEEAIRRLKNGENLTDIFPYVEDYRNRYGVALVKINRGSWNIVNTNNELLSKDRWFDYASLEDDNIIRVKYHSKYSLIKFNGEYILEGWYDKVYVDHLYRVVMLSEDGKYNLASIEDGKLISPEVWFDWMGRIGDHGLRLACLVRVDSKFNMLMLREKRFLCRQWFFGLGHFSGKRAVVINNEGKYSFIDTNGDLITEKWFDDATEFKNGIAKVKVMEEHNFKSNFIKENGELLCDEWFDSIEDFKHGFARVRKFDRNFGSIFNFIDYNGRLLSPNQWFDFTIQFNGSTKITPVKFDGKWNYLSVNGDIIFNQGFDDAGYFDMGFSMVRNIDENGKYKYNFVNERGSLVSPNVWFEHVMPFGYKRYTEVRIEGEEGSFYLLKDGHILKRRPEDFSEANFSDEELQKLKDIVKR